MTYEFILGFALAFFIELVVLSRMDLPGANQPPRNIFPLRTCSHHRSSAHYALIDGVFAALGALIYNVASRWVGGLQIDIN
ncbi:MAG: hypothetical protein DMG30_05460 [Acidobacteria bacterium]|nr:MAG: hypothetical protein DMG30_05460 [Acidobacteriota bacterium]